MIKNNIMKKNTNINLCNFSTNNITFLNEIKTSNIKLFKTGFYHYFRLDDINDFIYPAKFDYTRIRDFLEVLDPDKDYIVYPLLMSSSKSDNTSPVIHLSSPILVSRDSKYKLLINFFIKQTNDLLYQYEIENIQGFVALKYRPFIIKNVYTARQ